ncbi:hypothetical protein B0T41_21545 [Chromobacterium violaceum]|nr:hypothetical protein B0T41_21545 [Chromobacterium violaceum]
MVESACRIELGDLDEQGFIYGYDRSTLKSQVYLTNGRFEQLESFVSKSLSPTAPMVKPRDQYANIPLCAY